YLLRLADRGSCHHVLAGGAAVASSRCAPVALLRRGGRERRLTLDHRCVGYTGARSSCATPTSFASLAALPRSRAQESRFAARPDALNRFAVVASRMPGGGAELDAPRPAQ